MRPVTSDCRSKAKSLHHRLHAALKELSGPSRTTDSRAEAFAMYRKEYDEFDREYAGGYGGDLKASLVFVKSLIFVLYTDYRTQNHAGGPLFCSQPNLYNRYPIRAGTRPE